MIHKSSGILRYSHAGDAGFKLIVEIDPGIAAFYRALIPKYIKTNPQKYDPHISVVRKEHTVNMDFWGKYEGESVDFEYDSHIHHGKVYWWLNVFSARLEEIRAELGLPVSSEYTRPPEGYIKCFHTTIGNTKAQVDQT
jgi:hypothetical protein